MHIAEKKKYYIIQFNEKWQNNFSDILSKLNIKILMFYRTTVKN